MTTSKQNTTFATEAQAYWRGERPLWQAFWVYGMFFGTLLGTVMTPLSQFALQFLLQDVERVGLTPDNLLGLYAMSTLLSFWWIYYLWHIVGVWRCGTQSSFIPKWGSRIFVLTVTFTYWPLWFYVLIF